MRPIDRIIKASKDKRESFHVEDWDLDIYYTPLTPSDQSAIDKRLKGAGLDRTEDTHERDILTFIQKAEDEDGARHFEWGDQTRLLEHAPSAIVQYFIVKMYEGSLGGIKGAKKNLETMIGSDSD